MTFFIALGYIGEELDTASPDLRISCNAFVFASDYRLSALELKQRDSRFSATDTARIRSGSKYLYLWLTIRNDGSDDKELILANLTRNYYTELLRPAPGGALRIYRQGDIVPVRESPVRHNLTAFPILLPAGSRSDFILEYHGPRGIVADPRLFPVSSYIDAAAGRRAVSGVIAGVFLALLLFNSISGILGRKRELLAVAAFIFAEFLFFLRQSRLLLLLIDPLVYPEWLYPLTIMINLVFGSLLGYVLLRDYLQRWIRTALVVILSSSFITTGISFFVLPYVAADILNCFSVALLGILVIPIVRAIRARNRKILMIVLSFVPWIIAMLMDIATALMSARAVGLAEYRTIFGLLSQLVFLTIIMQMVQIHEKRQQSADVQREADLLRSERGRTLSSLARLRAAVLNQVSSQLRTPLDALLSSARQLLREYNEPGIVASVGMMIEDVQNLKQRIGETVTTEEELPQFSPATELRETGSGGDKTASGKIWIYDDDEENTRFLLRILQPRGFSLHAEPNKYSVMQAAENGEIDVLIIDPVSNTAGGIRLCRLLRSQYNMLQLPILMISDAYADYLINQGYASGANDFLTRPYDPSELAARIQSLVKLKEVVRHNMQLARSEEEKNTFLYFLTHNVNTPLTILLNRIRDLQSMVSLDDLEDIVEDLSSSTLEINDVVQNVLVSFRIADGRQTVRFEEIDITDVLCSLGDLEKKAKNKRQDLRIQIPDILPPAYGDRTSVRSILYNLIDNAVKFTPAGGSIEVLVRRDDALMIEVRDSGPGIPEDEREAVFRRFQRLSPRPTGGESSTGLGLYVARELARINGGDIEYLPAERGARFILRLALFRQEGADVQI